MPLLLALLFAAVAIATMGGALVPMDAMVRDAIHAHASASLTALAHALSLVGSNVVWVPFAGATIAVLWFLEKQAEAFVFLVTMSGAALWENGLKLVFHRARPEAFFAASPWTYSFPSGHALFAVCLYGALASLLVRACGQGAMRVIIWAIALLMPLCIGVSRIYLGLHYPSDVLAGWLSGGAWLTALRAARLPTAPTSSR